MLIDTHCHLQFKNFDNDREEAYKRALDANVKKMICVGCCMQTSEDAHNFSLDHEGFFSTVGVHPTSADKYDDDIEAFYVSRMNINPKIVAIGETGLDYYHFTVDKSIQIDVFKSHINLAKEFHKPIIIHIRDKDGIWGAYDDVLKVLDEEKFYNAVVHCFSGNLNCAKEFWKRGVMTSFTGVITYSSCDYLNEVVLNVPDDLFMIETDSPFLPPNRSKKERCEPAYVVDIAIKIADIKGVSFEEISKISTTNAIGFFKI